MIPYNKPAGLLGLRGNTNFKPSLLCPHKLGLCKKISLLISYGLSKHPCLKLASCLSVLGFEKEQESQLNVENEDKGKEDDNELGKISIVKKYVSIRLVLPGVQFYRIKGGDAPPPPPDNF